MDTQQFIPTQPKDDVKVVRFIKLNGVSITPFKGANINVDTFTQEKSWIYNRLLSMNTETYLNWNNNDEFLISWVLTQLGLSPDPTPNIPPPSPLVRSDNVPNLNMNYIPENSLPSFRQDEPISPSKNNDFIEV